MDELKLYAGLSHNLARGTGLCTNMFDDCVTTEEAASAKRESLSRAQVAAINMRVQAAWDKIKELNVPNKPTESSQASAKLQPGGASPKKKSNKKKKCDKEAGGGGEQGSEEEGEPEEEPEEDEAHHQQ